MNTSKPRRSAIIVTAVVMGLLMARPGSAQQTADSPENPDAAGPVELFDGKTLQGWSGDPQYWSVEDGVIVGQTREGQQLPHNTFLIWQGQPVEDFQLELEYRMSEGNSGLQFRSVDEGNHRVSGYQADFDAGNNYTGIIYEEKGRGILARRTRHVMIDSTGKRSESDEATCDEAALLESIRPGDWNTCRVVARGSQLTNSINGFVTARLDDGEYDKARDSGVIALQLHTGPPMKIEFRNIRLTRLSESQRQP